MIVKGFLTKELDVLFVAKLRTFHPNVFKTLTTWFFKIFGKNQHINICMEPESQLRGNQI